MTVLPFVVVASIAAAIALAVRSRSRVSAIVGLVGLVACVALALAIQPGQVSTLGGGGLATTDYQQRFLVLAALVSLGLAVAGLAAGTRRDAPAVSLAVLAAAGLTIGLVDPRAAVLVATTGGLFGVILTLVPGGARAGATVGIREARAVVVAGALAIAAAAWIGRDLRELDAQPVVFGLAYLAMATAVAMRFGAIPFHLWAARLADVVPETALPIVTAIAPATLAIVALGWVDVMVIPRPVDLGIERLLVIAVALVTIVLAAVAAFVQDDLEHVLGYAIVSDAGVIILALAVLEPGAGAPARTWILAFVVGRSAFAAWTAGIRTGLWTGRVTDLRGWVRRSPILAAAFVVIAVAGVGFPGLAAYDARTTLVDLALDPPFSTVVLVATLAPIAYYARLFAIGVAPPDHIIETSSGWAPRFVGMGGTGVRRWLAMNWDRNRPFTTAVVAAALAGLALVTSAGVLGGH
jgi:formate hydrogenlyase subunit 3/multisubunit Na+/H+ antiporter MnhD subunit